MAQHFSFRSVNERVGTMVVFAALVVVTVVVVAGRQRWFEPMARVTVNLPGEGSYGLKSGARIDLLGVSIGFIERIEIDANGEMKAMGTVRKDFTRFIGRQSSAEIKKSLVLAGDAYLEISRDPNADAQGRPIVLDAFVRGDSTEKLAELITSVGALMEDLRAPERPFQRTLEHLSGLTRAVDEGQGVLGRLLRDETLTAEVTGSLRNLKQATQRLTDTLEGFDRNITATASALQDGSGAIAAAFRRESASIAQSFDRQSTRIAQESARVTAAVDSVSARLGPILDGLERTTEALPKLLAAFEGEAKQLPGMIYEARSAITETRRLVEAMQRHWLIRSYVEGVPPTRRIAPTMVGTGGSAQSGK